MRIGILCLLVALAASAWAEPAGEFVFVKAPFASAHASTIVELPGGDLLAAWFGGSAEGKPDVAVWSARKSGGRWSEPAELVREPNIACYNPVLFYSRNGRLWLYYKFGPHPTSWSAGRRWSDDDGKTWSPVEHLPAGLYGPIRAKPLVLDEGTILSGTSVESYHNWACWIERSTDNGKTWTRIGPITVPRGPAQPALSGSSGDPFAWDRTWGILQPSLVPLAGKTVRLYARSTSQIGKICAADSRDGGLTWTHARPLDLPNPNSGIDAVALRDGRIVLVYNHTATGRTPLNLAVSEDGETFRMFHTIEDGPGEFSYPALIQGRDGGLHLTYTWNRKRIRYVHIPLADVPGK
jgi:predicted neuraminidase